MNLTHHLPGLLLLGILLLRPDCQAATPPNVVILFTDDQGTLDADGGLSSALTQQNGLKPAAVVIGSSYIDRMVVSSIGNSGQVPRNYGF